MAKSKISQMSLDEIFGKVGGLIGVEQLKYVVIEIKGSNVFDCKPKQVIDYLKNHEDNVDKERLVFCIAINLRKALEEKEYRLSNEHRRQATRCYNNAKELLKDVNPELPYITEKNGRSEIEYFYTVNDFLERPKNPTTTKQKNDALVKDMEEHQMLEKVVSNISASDFRDCLCYYNGNGNFLEYVVQANFYQLVEDCKRTHQASGKNFSEKELKDLEELAYTRELGNVIKKYSDKIDIEKIMLLSAYRAKEVLRDYFDYVTFTQNNDCAVVMEYVSRKINPKMAMNAKVCVLYEDKKEYMRYSVKELTDDLKRIVTSTKGVKSYFGKQKTNKMREALLNGKETLNEVIKTGVFPLMNFSEKEKQELIKQEPYNFETLVAFGCLTSEEIRKALTILGEYKIESVDYLYQEGLIDKTDLVKMYMSNQMHLNKALDCDALYDLKSEVNVEEMMGYYTKTKEDASNPKDFERYALLFREVKLKGQKTEVQTKLSEQIVEKIYETESDYKEDFKKLYQSDLLPIRMLMDWNGEEIVYDLITNQQLKPRDAKDLLMTKELDLKKVYKVLRNSHMSEEEKMNFIFSSFDGTGKNEEEIKAQNEARMYLIQAVCISKDITYGEKSSNGKERRNVTEGMKRNKYVTDPVYRWQLFSQMDSNCVSKAYLDGTVVFTLPNVENGTVVIEKMYKGTKEGTKINHGSATYVMSEEEFVNHKSQIEQDRKINRKVLIQLMEEGKADKIIHSKSWGKGLKKHLGFSVESGYSEEKMAKIDELVARIERARELVR